MSSTPRLGRTEIINGLSGELRATISEILCGKYWAWQVLKYEYTLQNQAFQECFQMQQLPKGGLEV